MKNLSNSRCQSDIRCLSNKIIKTINDYLSIHIKYCTVHLKIRVFFGGNRPWQRNYSKATVAYWSRSFPKVANCV